jgi:cytochrome c peroxidase
MHLSSKLWKKNFFLFLFFCAALIVLVFGYLNSQKEEDIDIGNIFGPALPTDLFSPGENVSKAMIDLGRTLYFDPRLSKNRDLSCNSCHQLHRYGVDNHALSRIHPGQFTRRNTPSVYHAAGNIAQCWDGRFPNVEEQAKASILDPQEMGMSSPEKVLEVLSTMPEYVAAFQNAFPANSESLTYDNVGKAIGAFLRGLITNSPFDKYFLGDKNALSRQQKEGMKLFLDVGCATCHNGTYLGGQLFRKVGLIVPWPNQDDLGRYEITKEKSDLLVFKVSSLRNITKTAPYYHDGLIKNLDDAIKHMAVNQLGKQLSVEQINDIIAFLESLTGELPREYIKRPKLPEITNTALNPSQNS